MRYLLPIALALFSSSCSLITIRHCTNWNLLPYFGIDYAAPTCDGGQPTPTHVPTVSELCPECQK